MMQSGRGPGVIGMLLAMVVLAGFSVLFLLAFNEDPAGSKLTPEAIIHDQEKEIVELSAAITQRRTNLEPLPKLQAAERRLSGVKQEIKTASDRAEAAKANIADLTSRISTVQTELEDYKNRYRESSRLGAKGEDLGTLTTRSGKVYQKAVIREVNALGMRIAYDGGAGATSIPFEELPPALQDRFQFDPKQRDELLAKQRQSVKAQDEVVKEVLDQAKNLDSQRKSIEDAQRKENARRAIALKKSQIITLDGEIQQLEIDLVREMQKKLRQTNAIKSKIATKQQQRTQLMTEIGQLEASLAP